MIEKKFPQPAWDFDHLDNVGHVVSATAARMGDAVAVAEPSSRRAKRPIRYGTISFAQLENISNQVALGVQSMGIEPGCRLALMVPPGIDFVGCVFGLFKAGVTVILIDPGMGRSNMIQCLRQSRPDGIVGIALAQLLRTLLLRDVRGCRNNVVVGRGWWPGCVSAASFQRFDGQSFKPVELSREAPAAIIFTTGSTGPPKGVLYRHRIFLEQARLIRDYFDIRPGTVDVSGFPLFALFNVAMGTTTVFPKMDATRPAEVDPLDILDAIESFQADQSFGSPALWNTVSRYALKHELSFPTIRRVLTAGAPVPPAVLSRIKSIIHPDGEAYTPYGATESLPIACHSATEILNETAAKTAAGAGTCVGHRFDDIQWQVIPISDEPISQIDQVVPMASGQIGELIVKGPVVTDQYVTQTQFNRLQKIQDDDGIWHRMGDVGYLDEQDRFWFCGRKSHRVITQSGTLFTIPVEGIVNTHPAIYRSALVGVGRAPSQRPVIIVEPFPEAWPATAGDRQQLLHEISELCRQHDLTKGIETVLIHKSLPVDIRHNSKIFRERLSAWAEKQR